jgi:hypothetical protein
VHNGRARFWLNSDRAGSRAVVITLTAQCDSSADEGETGDGGAPRYEDLDTRPDGLSVVRFDRFPGGCARYDFELDDEDAPALFSAVEGALGYTPRTSLIAHVDEEFGLRLCGRGVSCPG